MSVAIDALDADHKDAVDIVAAVQDALEAGDPTAALAAAAELLLSCRTHFRREEDLLARYGFPDLAYHRRGHAQALARCDEMHRLIRARQMDQAALSLAKFKANFIERLIIDDLAYKTFFEERGLRPACAQPAAPGPDLVHGAAAIPQP